MLLQLYNNTADFIKKVLFSTNSTGAIFLPNFFVSKLLFLLNFIVGLPSFQTLRNIVMFQFFLVQFFTCF